MTKKRILYIGGDTRLPYLRAHAAPHVTVDASPPQDTRGVVESRYDELSYAPAVVERVIWAEREGYDACLMACFGDPGIDAARETVSIPVVAPGEASYAMASMLGRRFSIVTVLENVVGMLEERVAACGMADKLASIRTIGMRVEDARDDQALALQKVAQAARSCIQEDGAQVVILGCGSLSILAHEIQTQLGVPVLNPLLVSLKTAEAMLGASLTHSKLAYPLPPSMQMATASQ